jgi:hypothetical protein
MVKLGLDRLMRWVRLRRQRDSVDAADAGTTFGMELVFEATEAELQVGRVRHRTGGYRPSLYCTSKSKM